MPILRKPVATALVAAIISVLSPAIAPASVANKCVREDSNFVSSGGLYWFETKLGNSCGHRLLCKISMLVTDATGVYRGTGTLSLPAQTNGISASNAWRLRTGASGGSGEVAYACK